MVFKLNHWKRAMMKGSDLLTANDACLAERGRRT